MIQRTEQMSYKTQAFLLSAMSNRGRVQPGTRNPYPSADVLLLVLVAMVRATNPVLVSIQTQDQASMDALTRAIYDIAVSGSGGADRVMLGAIEATASRVVDVNSPTLATLPETLPTLSLLDTISYDSTDLAWTVKYRTSRVDGPGHINSFHRHLYDDDDLYWYTIL